MTATTKMEEQEAPAPVPFSPSAPQGTGAGCGRVGIIGCGVLILLLGAAAVVFLLKAGDLFAWAMTRFEAEIIAVLPEDFTEEERQRLQQAFANATEAVRSGEFDPLALQRLQGKLRDSILDESDRLSRDEVLELIDLLEKLSGTPDGSESDEKASAPAQVAALAAP